MYTDTRDTKVYVDTKVSVGSVDIGFSLHHNCYCWQYKGYLLEVLNLVSLSASRAAMQKL